MSVCRDRSPNNRSTHSYNRALKLHVCALALLLGAVGHGQWLETTIPLYDSLGTVGGAYSLAWDSADNKLLVGGSTVIRVESDGLSQTRKVILTK